VVSTALNESLAFSDSALQDLWPEGLEHGLSKRMPVERLGHSKE
jgi:hypothetical protein